MKSFYGLAWKRENFASTRSSTSFKGTAMIMTSLGKRSGSCHDDPMNATMKSDGVRLTLLFAVYLLIPLVAKLLAPLLTTNENYGALAIVNLFLVYPTVTIALAVWSGSRGGNIFLWTFAPVLFFLAPMYIFFNDSALIYGAIYSCLSLAACGIGRTFHQSHPRK